MPLFRIKFLFALIIISVYPLSLSSSDEMRCDEINKSQAFTSTKEVMFSVSLVCLFVLAQGGTNKEQKFGDLDLIRTNHYFSPSIVGLSVALGNSMSINRLHVYHMYIICILYILKYSIFNSALCRGVHYVWAWWRSALSSV